MEELHVLVSRHPAAARLVARHVSALTATRRRRDAFVSRAEALSQKHAARERDSHSRRRAGARTRAAFTEGRSKLAEHPEARGAAPAPPPTASRALPGGRHRPRRLPRPLAEHGVARRGAGARAPGRVCLALRRDRAAQGRRHPGGGAGARRRGGHLRLPRRGVAGDPPGADARASHPQHPVPPRAGRDLRRRGVRQSLRPHGGVHRYFWTGRDQPGDGAG